MLKSGSNQPITDTMRNLNMNMYKEFDRAKYQFSKIVVEQVHEGQSM